MRTKAAAPIAALTMLAWVAVPAHGQDDELSLLTGPSLRALQLHSTRFIETPDGVFWDMWGEQEYLKVFNRAARKRAIKERRTGPILAEWVTVDHRWVIEDTRDAIAWGVTGERSDVREWYWERSIDGTPPLWHALSASELSFIYINERDRNVIAADGDKRSTKVVADLGGGLFRVEVSEGRGFEPDRRTTPSRLDGNAVVQIDNPSSVIRQGWLTGEFILWPDDSIVPPAGVHDPTYRYIPAAELRPTRERLGRAVLEGRAELVTWTYRREAGAWRWIRRTVPVELFNRDELEARRRRAAERAAETEPPPELDKTHVLVLRNGDYLYGRLISESEDEVRFLVVVGSIGAERVFDREDVGKLTEIDPNR